MRTSFAAGLVAAATLATAQVPVTGDFTPDELENGFAFNNVSLTAEANMKYNIGQRNAACTYDNALQRQEWRTLDTATRKSFTDAATCLMSHPPTRMTDAESGQYPGVKSRHDEYVATHINFTLNVHDTADFFAWHRTFIHFWEQDLINLCGYSGVLPYWNWALDAAAPQDSPLFTGDEFSMGGNGEYIADRGDTWLAAQVRHDIND